MTYFCGLLVLNFVFYDENSIHVEIHQECKDCHGHLLACDEQRYSGASIPLSLWRSNFPRNLR